MQHMCFQYNQSIITFSPLMIYEICPTKNFSLYHFASLVESYSFRYAACKMDTYKIVEFFFITGKLNNFQHFLENLLSLKSYVNHK